MFLWFDKHKQELQGIVRIAVNAADQEKTILTPEKTAQIEQWLGQNLDLTPVGKAALQVFRPMWPMTVPQLRAQVEELPRVNPAPVFLPGRRRSNEYHVSSVEGTSFASPKDERAIDGMAWRMSAPEGFPPIPRRGGVYNKVEGKQVRTWLEYIWPVAMEMRALAEKRNDELEADGVGLMIFEESNSIGRSARNVRDWLQMAIFSRLPDPEGLSPKELHQKVLEWARDWGLAAVESLKTFRPSLLTGSGWTDPDAYALALASNSITGSYYSIGKTLERVYHLPMSLLARLSIPRIPVSERYGDRPHVRSEGRDLSFPDVVRLHKKQQEEAEKARAVSLAKYNANRDLVAGWMRGILDSGRKVSRVNLEKILPEGWKLVSWKDRWNGTASLRGPNNWSVDAMGKNESEAIANLAGKVGIK